MEKITTIREIQDRELGILKKLLVFFKDNNISYCMSGGSVLGAVRHNGFIPWDDDIDVLVNRKDYDRIMYELDSSSLEKDGITIKKPGMPGHIYPFIKVVSDDTLVKDAKVLEKFHNTGLWVDIFPLDHYPDDEKKHVEYVRKNKFLARILAAGTCSYVAIGSWKKISIIVFKLLYILCGGHRVLTRKIDRFARKTNAENLNSTHYGNGTWPENLRKYYDDSMVGSFTTHVFEDVEVNIPRNYEGFLTRLYGDYMALPPEDKRNRHIIECFKK
jgi:lipopolysaccharide cholinephosphotransferase